MMHHGIMGDKNRVLRLPRPSAPFDKDLQNPSHPLNGSNRSNLLLTFGPSRMLGKIGEKRGGCLLSTAANGRRLTRT
jgi:hypothetical protein